MRPRPPQIVLAFVLVGVLAVVAVLITANVFFSGPSAATLEANAVSACANSLDGFEVGEAYAEIDHRNEIKAASFEDGAFHPDRLQNESETVYYVTGTGYGEAALVCTAVAVDGGMFMTQYEPVAGTWLG